MTAVASATQTTTAAVERFARTDGGGSSSNPNPMMGSRMNDGYSSFWGGVARNGLIGAGMGAVAGLALGPLSVPVGAAVGGAVGAASTLIRHPRASAAVGDGMKGAVAGFTGGAVVGTVTPLGPMGGAVAGGVGGFLTGTVSGALKNHAGGKHSIEGQTTLGGRIVQGAKLGAISGGVVGAGAGLMLGGVTMPVGAAWGALIGGVGGGLYGAVSGITDGVTCAKGMRLGGGSGGNLPGLPGLPRPGAPSTPGQDPVQHPGQAPDCPPCQK